MSSWARRDASGPKHWTPFCGLLISGVSMPMRRTRIDSPSIATLIVSPSVTEVTGKGPSAVVGRTAVALPGSAVSGSVPVPRIEQPASVLTSREVGSAARREAHALVVTESGTQSRPCQFVTDANSSVGATFMAPPDPHAARVPDRLNLAVTGVMLD